MSYLYFEKKTPMTQKSHQKYKKCHKHNTSGQRMKKTPGRPLKKIRLSYKWNQPKCIFTWFTFPKNTSWNTRQNSEAYPQSSAVYFNFLMPQTLPWFWMYISGFGCVLVYLRILEWGFTTVVPHPVEFLVSTGKPKKLQSKACQAHTWNQLLSYDHNSG